MVPALKELEEGLQDKAAENKDTAPLLNTRTATMLPLLGSQGSGEPPQG